MVHHSTSSVSTQTRKLIAEIETMHRVARARVAANIQHTCNDNMKMLDVV